MVSGSRLPLYYGSRKPTAPRGRVCAHEGCATVLSTYNRTPFCSLHAGEKLQKPRQGAVKRCTKCGSVYPATEEHWPLDARGKGGLGPQCKYCVRAYKRTWRLTAVQRAQQEIEVRLREERARATEVAR